jgi:hypothetical protein
LSLARLIAASKTTIMSGTQTQGALPAPPGVTVDFDNDHNPLRVTYITSLVFILVFPALAVPMRFYTKIFLMKAIKPTDIFCLVGLVSVVSASHEAYD